MFSTWRISAVLALALVLGACQLLPDLAGQAPATGHAHVTSHQMVGTYTFQNDYFESPILRAPVLATRLGMMLDAHHLGTLQIETQGIEEDGNLTSWLPLEMVWAEGLARVYGLTFDRPVRGARIRVAQASVEDFVF